MTSIIDLNVLSWHPTTLEIVEYIEPYWEERDNLIISVVFPMRLGLLPYSYVNVKEVLDARFNVKFHTATLSYFSDQCFFYIESPNNRIIIQSIKQMWGIDEHSSIDKVAETLELEYISGKLQ